MIADRISGTGSISAIGGPNWHPGSNCRIRLEAFFRTLAGSTTPVSSNTAPVVNQDFNLGSLIIESVAGENVMQPPSGDTQNPDVIFTEEGDISVVVRGDSIPDGTPVTLRIAASGVIITKPEGGEPEVTLQDGTATFAATVPAGIGTIQALAEFTVSGN